MHGAVKSNIKKQKNIKKTENTDIQKSYQTNSDFWMQGVDHEKRRDAKIGNMRKENSEKNFRWEGGKRHVEKKNR